MLNRPILKLPKKPEQPVPQDIGPTADAVTPVDMIATPVEKAGVSDWPAPEKRYPRSVRCPQYGGFARQRFAL